MGLKITHVGTKLSLKKEINFNASKNVSGFSPRSLWSKVIWNIVWCFVYFRFSKCRFIPIQLFHCTVQRKFTRAFCFYKTCFWQLLLINSLMWFIAILQISQKLIFYTFIDEICTRYIQLMWIYLFTWKNHTLCNYN